ncbi:unnamed protein product [Dracunculus medinensis]|uniref:Uncharacterized protein n=1 Tax=Dracunculus medinensis TaxID=318479 RepID=A0A3P7Q0V9_DRAME|nr:unnamed protein product [Dracunculus medinensis]
MFAMFTCFYALIIFIIGLVLELSNILDDQPSMVFSIFMYGGSVAFFLYCHVVLMKSRISRNMVNGIRRATINDEKLQYEDTQSYPTGSLYIRLGCIVFGIFGVVNYGLILTVCILENQTGGNNCNTCTIISVSLAIIFIFIQMHFVFCNSKIKVYGSVKIARLGLMHLVATNLWTWIRYILIEEKTTTTELGHANFGSNLIKILHEIEKKDYKIIKFLLCVYVCMYTCVVEYALICAGMTIVFWINLAKGTNEYRKHKRHKPGIISVDCSRTSTGLFLGFAIISFTLICIAIFNTYIYHHESEFLANAIFFSADGIVLLSSLIAIIFAFFRLKDLNYKKKKADIDESSELLDRILLVVGLVGQLIFSIGGIISLLNSMNFNYMIIVLIAIQFLRFFQVVLQSALLLIGSKLQAASPESQFNKPGKQVITFLLICNIALFIMNTFEAQKAGVTENIVRYFGSKAWALLVRGCSPLTIFYRFHSSACFAEIWKHAFKSASGEF